MAGADEPARVASPVTAPTGFVPTLYVFGTEHNAADWKKLEGQLAVLVRSGRLRVLSKDNIRPGDGRAAATDRMLRESDAALVLMSANTLADGNHAHLLASYDRPIAPVLLRPCLWQADGIVGHRTPIPADGRALSVSDDWMGAAKDILTFAATMRPKTSRAAFSAEAIHAAVLSASLERGSLLTGIDPRIVGSLPTKSSPSSQHWSDIHTLQEMGVIADGTRPFRRYLQNARWLASQLPQGDVFANALAMLDR